MLNTVPVIQDTADLETATGRQRNQASPDAFGAGQARGAAALAEGIGKVAEVAAHEDDLADETNARDLANQLSARIRTRLYNTNDGYLSTQRGINALNSRGQTEADIDTIANELAVNARNPRAAQRYRELAGQQVSGALGDVATHAAQENTNYQNTVSEAHIQEAMDNVVAHYGDPASVAGYTDAGISEIQRVGQLNGWDSEIVANRIRRFQSDATSRVIVATAATDPAAADQMYQRLLPTLSADDAAQLQTTIRAVRRQTEDDTIDQAWAYVSDGQRIPPDLWQRVPGRARIDIQNELRRRAEGGDGGGDRARATDLQVMALSDPRAFARVDLRAERSRLGESAYRQLALAQTQIQNGTEDQTVEQQRTALTALIGTAGEALAPYGFDVSPTERAPQRDRDRANAFRGALLRELQTYQTQHPGQSPSAEDAQVLIGRAVVAMRGNNVPDQLRIQNNGARSGNRNGAVPSMGEAVVPYELIPDDLRQGIVQNLQRRLGRVPSRGEVENAYSRYLSNEPLNASAQ